MREGSTFKMSEDEWRVANGRAQRQWDFLWMTPEEKEAAKKSARDRGERKPEPDQS